jgi:hypothetical protein
MKTIRGVLIDLLTLCYCSKTLRVVAVLFFARTSNAGRSRRCSNAFCYQGYNRHCRLLTKPTNGMFCTKTTIHLKFHSSNSDIYKCEVSTAHIQANTTATVFRHPNLETSMEARRLFLRRGSAAIVAAVFQPNIAANSFDMEYPMELRAPMNVNDIRNADNRRLRLLTELRQQKVDHASNPIIAKVPIFGSVLWGTALWFLSGSRSNPITTPLANLIYDSKQEVWLQDRNDGLFANLPWEYFIILAVVFVALGFGADVFVSTIVEGDRTISLQLAGVCLIGGCSLELGRISSGAKKQTREESDRSVQLEIEFNSFADNRLQSGGNCHRSEVVQAFRRYYGKYRQTDSTEYPLSDLEIEQQLRSYCRSKGLEMSPAGFYTGIQINLNSDVFVRK